MKFFIRDPLLVTFIVALVAGWWVDRRRLQGEVKRSGDERIFYFNELSKCRSLPTPMR